MNNERVKVVKRYTSEEYLAHRAIACSTWTCFSPVQKKFNETGETWKYQIKSRLN